TRGYQRPAAHLDLVIDGCHELRGEWRRCERNSMGRRSLSLRSGYPEHGLRRLIRLYDRLRGRQPGSDRTHNGDRVGTEQQRQRGKWQRRRWWCYRATGVVDARGVAGAAPASRGSGSTKIRRVSSAARRSRGYQRASAALSNTPGLSRSNAPKSQVSADPMRSATSARNAIVMV